MLTEVIRKISSVPSSFVKTNMKLTDETGAGEARLFIGNKSEFPKLNIFFGIENSNEKYQYITKYIVKFDRENFLDYMKYVKLEHVFQFFHKYKGTNLDEWNKNFNKISMLAEEEFVVKLYTVNDKNRYYVRADEIIFKEYLRLIVVPKITDLLFIKNEEEKTIHISLEVNYNYHNTSEVCDETQSDGEETISFSSNLLLYGVPGCGKSYYVEENYEKQISNDQCKIRVVFHPDYTYSDFVGQIMPVIEKVDKEGADGEQEEKLKYKFVPGPFTRILKVANENKNEKCLLIIEELNRGNAPAIFGEVFQLLDRAEDGSSKYSIYNSDIAKEVYGDAKKPVKLPPNLTIVATMNTSDQNVFTMDTAFQRRWQMKHIPNRFIGDSLDDATKEHVAKPVPGSKISWGAFATVVNSKMGKAALGMAGTEDKSLGVYFATDNDLDDKNVFAEKVLKYLWDDAFRLARSELFKDYDRSLAHIIETFEDATDDPLQSVLQKEVYEEMQAKQPKFVLKDKDTDSDGDTFNEDSSGDAE